MIFSNVEVYRPLLHPVLLNDDCTVLPPIRYGLGGRRLRNLAEVATPRAVVDTCTRRLKSIDKKAGRYQQKEHHRFNKLHLPKARHKPNLKVTDLPNDDKVLNLQSPD